MDAAGRDFHDFNTIFRDNDDYEIVAFTHTSMQKIGELNDESERTYPASLAGDQYPHGIPIYPESELESLIEKRAVNEVIFSYSDMSHKYVMNQASRVLAAGADFRLIGTEMMLDAGVPVVVVDAVRTGCGKSQAARKLATILTERGQDVVVVREPMPYGDLGRQRVQRFETIADLAEQNVTIEEREEYEHHLEQGHVVYAGVDYGAILKEVEDEADVILWDGGNNELPFYEPDLHFVLTDPHRVGHERRHHPGETNLRLADYVIINKENTADQQEIATIEQNVHETNPAATIIHADSVVSVEDESMVANNRVLAVEDGPTLTHGGTAEGAAAIAAEKFGATELVDPRPGAVGSIRETLDKYPHLHNVLPAMGYSDEQIEELERTISNIDCDVVLAGTPIDLETVIDVEKPVVRVRYEIDKRGTPDFRTAVEEYADTLE